MPPTGQIDGAGPSVCALQPRRDDRRPRGARTRAVPARSLRAGWTRRRVARPAHRGSKSNRRFPPMSDAAGWFHGIDVLAPHATVLWPPLASVQDPPHCPFALRPWVVCPLGSHQAGGSVGWPVEHRRKSYLPAADPDLVARDPPAPAARARSPDGGRWRRRRRSAPSAARQRSSPPRCRSHNALSHPVRMRR